MRQLDSCDFCGTAPEGVFEVVPASVAGEARRLALCADCRVTLQSVTDPLLDAADTGTASSAGASEAGDAVSDSTAGSTGSPSPSSETSSTADSSTGNSTIPRSESASTSEPASVDASTPEPDSDDGVTIDAGGDGGATESQAPKPDGYAQVVRLLQNRDGAMPHDDLRALATNAYDLGDRQFEDAVDAAVENGDLRETDDGLRTA